MGGPRQEHDVVSCPVQAGRVQSLRPSATRTRGLPHVEQEDDVRVVAGHKVSWSGRAAIALVSRERRRCRRGDALPPPTTTPVFGRLTWPPVTCEVRLAIAYSAFRSTWSTCLRGPAPRGLCRSRAWPGPLVAWHRRVGLWCRGACPRRGADHPRHPWSRLRSRRPGPRLGWWRGRGSLLVLEAADGLVDEGGVRAFDVPIGPSRDTSGDSVRTVLTGARDPRNLAL